MGDNDEAAEVEGPGNSSNNASSQLWRSVNR